MSNVTHVMRIDVLIVKSAYRSLCYALLSQLLYHTKTLDVNTAMTYSTRDQQAPVSMLHLDCFITVCLTVVPQRPGEWQHNIMGYFCGPPTDSIRRTLIYCCFYCILFVFFCERIIYISYSGPLIRPH